MSKVQTAARWAFWINLTTGTINLGAVVLDIVLHARWWFEVISGAVALIVYAVAAGQYRQAFGKSIIATVIPQVPDSTEPIIAYRAWDIEGPADAPVLTPITQQKPWAIRKAEAANVDDYGYYAFKDEEALYQVLSGSSNRVVGRVAIWGRVKEHTQGYRAEYAYPQMLYTHPLLDEQRIKLVAERYGIETCPMPNNLRVHLDPMLEALQEQAREFSWKLLFESEHLRGVTQDFKAYADHMNEQRRIKAEQDAMMRRWRL